MSDEPSQASSSTLLNEGIASNNSSIEENKLKLIVRKS
jgi:hypothetical protein